MKRTEHRESKWKFPFVEYSPSETTGDERLPLVIQLHGAGERGEGYDDLCLVDVHGFSKIIKDKEIKCIFVMPQCPKESFWAARIESILEFIEQIKAEYNVDPDRVYLTGLSMGGYGTWYTAMARPDMFAAIAPVCGGGMAWNAGVLKMPVWAFHGAEDKLVPCFMVKEIYEACGSENKELLIVEGADHAQSYMVDKDQFEAKLDKMLALIM